MVSDRTRAVWAKTGRDGGELSLLQHLTDSALVATRLVEEWVPDRVLTVIGRGLPGGEGDARLIVPWLAGVHDIGKATPAFVSIVDRLLPGMARHGLEVSPAARRDRGRLPHAVAGHLALSAWLIAHGFEPGVATTYAVVVGGHHGLPPTNVEIKSARDVVRDAGGPVWNGVRIELLDRLAARTGVLARLPAWRDVALTEAAQVLLSGLVIMSDWIASSSQLFPLVEGEPDDPRAAHAWKALDLPPRWRPTTNSRPVAELFAARVALPAGGSPRPSQLAAVEHSRSVLPGLSVVELPMGEGKTETALLVAEEWAARTGASGVFFCLPTRSTSDGIYPRMLGWLDRLEPGDRPWSTFLAHGKAGLNTTWAGLTRSGPPGAVGDDPQHDPTAEAAVAHTWLSGRKKGPLSTFVVGTVDQLLFAALRSRHLALRHLALAGKVVVVDEVHAADHFMQVFLRRALTWLGAYGVPVLVLTATLPAEQREGLLRAYEDGLGAGGQPVPVGDRQVPAYPRTTTTGPAGRASRHLPASSRGSSVLLSRAPDDLDLLPVLVREARPADGVVLVLRNTVARAQAACEVLRDALPDDEVLLLHSRYLAHDRSVREQRVRDLLGPPGAGRQRPRRLVVVGTQVLEQSLDLDADLMITDLAPVDLVLQRLGRLHRHDRPRPAQLEQARCIVTGVDWQGDPPAPDRGSRAVYGLSALLRSAAVLGPHLDGQALGLPEDLDTLVQAGYALDLHPPPTWRSALAAADDDARVERADREARAARYLLRAPGAPDLRSWLRGDAGEVDEDSPAGQGTVRDGVGGVDVLLLKRVAGGVALPGRVHREQGVLPLDSVPDDRLARLAVTCTVPVPEYVRTSARAALDEAVPKAWQRSRWLRSVPVVPLDDSGAGPLGNHLLIYDEERGLTISRAAT